MAFKSAECPNCRCPISALRTLGSTAWSQWRCKQCGSKLGIDMKRRLLGVACILPIMVFLIFIARVQNYPIYYAIFIAGVPVLGAVYLLDRVRLLEPAGFRCRECGYDLQGQTNDICAECGTQFDAAQLTAYKSGLLPKPTPINPWLLRATLAVIVVGMTLTLILGIIRSKRSAAQNAAPANSAAPTTAGSPGTPPASADAEGDKP